MRNYFAAILAGSLLTACGGGGGEISASYSTIRQFSDGSGIARIKASQNNEDAILYAITPDVVYVVSEGNKNNSSIEPANYDIQDFPLVNQVGGYDFRQGVVDGVNVTIVAQSGNLENAKSAVYYFTGTDNVKLLMSMSEKLIGTPSGSFTYTGLYSVEDSRYPNWLQVGDMTLVADFDNKTFSIDANSADTSLRGDGFLDVNSGQLSSTALLLNDTDLDELRDASLIGNLGGPNASEAAGVWHTSENTPIYKGLIIGSR